MSFSTLSADVRRQQQNGTEPEKLSYSRENICEICGHVFNTMFTRMDQEILEMYYSTRWGDDRYNVEDYCQKHGVPDTVVWMVIRRAERLVIEDLGLLDRKG